MKVLILSNSDIQGGAARAAQRLQQGLQTNKVCAQMLVQHKSGKANDVLPITTNRIGESVAWSRIAVDNLPLKRYAKKEKEIFSLQWVPDQVYSKVERLNPDVINLHWVNAGFLRIETLSRFTTPIIWTLHDMWPFTGGCHYDQNCKRYTTACGQCPILQSTKENDLSRWVWNRKYNTFKQTNLTIVSPSKWLAECAKESSLLNERHIEVIPNSIDVSIYRPLEKKYAREILRLPSDKKIILFGALRATSDNRKGFHLLHPALNNLARAWSDRIEVAVFGSSLLRNSPDFGFKTHYLGTFSDDISLALAYSAADVFVAPSLQENLAYTVMEALSCGIPSVAFDIGGMPDMIEHHQNGYLAKPFEVADLAQGIEWILKDEQRYQILAKNARSKVLENHTLEIQAKRYSNLFERVCAGK